MSITRDQLIQFIEKPALLREQTIGELKEIVDEFPYFQSAQLLYTLNLFTQANFRFSVVQIADNPDNSDAFELFELLEENQVTETEFFDFSTLVSNSEETTEFDLLSFDQPDNLYQLDEEDEVANPLPADAPLAITEPIENEKVDLIEQFIKVNPTIQPRNESFSTSKEQSELKMEGLDENDEFITETLSRIYLKQGHHQKAIDSFRRLSLKFPEKSVYFAQQIEEIKKLLK
jgi:tetratricopeptide (TPR) repeat protein